MPLPNTPGLRLPLPSPVCSKSHCTYIVHLYSVIHIHVQSLLSPPPPSLPPPPPSPSTPSPLHTHTGGCLCCPSSGNKYSQLSNSETTPSQKPYDRVAATVCIFLFFVILFVFAVFETLGSPLTMDEFAWTKKEVVLYNNLFYVGLAFLAVFTFIAVKFITKK